jgi:hypothetical protein
MDSGLLGLSRRDPEDCAEEKLLVTNVEENWELLCVFRGEGTKPEVLEGQ